MASYAMAHLKIDLLLKETGFASTFTDRLKLFLTNSLEEPHSEMDTLFSNWLTTEAHEANKIKNETPVMCVIGNPPYFGFKSNEGEWITNLTSDYKFINGEKIDEKKHRLGNDYVKFIRFGQHFIEKNNYGILAYINDHGFLFNPTFKGMRWNLLRAFDEIYIIDLHGNSKKKETNEDGGKDENVFDIQQGVSINIFVKTGKKSTNEDARLFYYDLLGERTGKYDFLLKNDFRNVPFLEVMPTQPFYFFLPNKLIGSENYESGFLISKLFIMSVTGTVTGDDNNLIGSNKYELNQRLNNTVKDDIDYQYLKPIDYRPFDQKAMYFIETFNKNPYPQIHVPKSYRSRYKVMKHLSNKDNYGLIIGRQGQVVGNMPWNIIFISNKIVDLNMFYRGGGVVSPLYLKDDSSSQQTMGLLTDRTPNLNSEIVQQIAEKLGLNFTPEKEPTENTFAPIDILDYIYAVLHSHTYREKYKEFLKIDFPRVPYPKDAPTFWSLVEKGGAIRALHLLESPLLDKFITTYPESGTNQVGKVRYDNGKVYINETQYFDKVPQIAWEFYIGGYQPAQKWLKDRKDRVLTFEDILHYQKIIIALTETDRLMKEIDGLGVEW
jgi:predicted helicase